LHKQALDPIERGGKSEYDGSLDATTAFGAVSTECAKMITRARLSALLGMGNLALGLLERIASIALAELVARLITIRCQAEVVQ